MTDKQTLIDFWKANIQKNLKLISALISLIISKIIGVVFLGIRLGLDPLLILIMLLFVLEPFIYIWLRIIFTGEISATQTELELIKNQLKQEQTIAEYRVMLAARTGEIIEALKATDDWNKTNTAIKEVEENILHEKTEELTGHKLPEKY